MPETSLLPPTSMSLMAQVFPCNTCSLTFESSEDQRSHMRQPWHISNLQRRIAGLSMRTEAEFNAQAKSFDECKSKLSTKQTTASHGNHGSEAESAPADDSDLISRDPATQCLFCEHDSSTLDWNLVHMESQHNLYIPSKEYLLDLEIFITYLSMLVYEYHECLFCGVIRNAAAAIQAHMRDTGHCMLGMNAESELLDFWDFPEDEEDNEANTTPTVKLSDTEMRLASGTIVNSRLDPLSISGRPRLLAIRNRASIARNRRSELKAITMDETDSTSNQRQANGSRSIVKQLAVRGEMGLLGVSDAQRRTLQITVKKMKQREAIAKSAYRHAMEQQPKKTVYYKTENPVYQAG